MLTGIRAAITSSPAGRLRPHVQHGMEKPSWLPGSVTANLKTDAGVSSATPWVLLYCDECTHRARAALARFMVRSRASTSSYMLHRSSRCTECGAKGAPLMLPSWADLQTGMAPFPAVTVAAPDR